MMVREKRVKVRQIKRKKVNKESEREEKKRDPPLKNLSYPHGQSRQ